MSTKAGADKRLNSVSEGAEVCYLLSIPAADCCGRLPGDPFEYVCTVAPARRYPEDRAEQIVKELIGCGLYIAWDIGGQRVLSFPAKAWLEHQGRALNEDSRPEQIEPPEDLEGVLRVGYKIDEERARYGVTLAPPRKNAKKRGRTPRIAAPPPPSPPPSPSLSPPPVEDNGLAPVANAPSPPRPTWPAESDALRAIPGYPFDEQKDRALFDLLAETYQQLDLAAEVKKCHAWLMKNELLPLRGKVGPRRRVGNWIGRADRYGRAEQALLGRAGTGNAPTRHIEEI